MLKASPCCTPSGRSNQPTTSAVVPAGRPAFQLDVVDLDGGAFEMGSDAELGHPADGEAPARLVEVGPFGITRTTVTNEEFREFVGHTGFVTDAERFGWSFVFEACINLGGVLHPAVTGAEWWRQVPGAYWKRPFGPGSSVNDKLRHPVVHVSWNDAAAFATWVGGRLPTEAEWECAARGGLPGKTYPWGNELRPNGVAMCNIFDGHFPTPRLSDGYVPTVPVDEFEANGFGLHNAVGNVWEWCADWFSDTFHVGAARLNPTGPPSGVARVLKGGSYLCHDSYCNRYRVAARTSATPDSSIGHTGFRVVKDISAGRR